MNSTAAMGKIKRQGVPRLVRSVVCIAGLPALPSPPLPGMAVRFEEFDVPGIGLESDVKKVAHDRDRPDGDVEQNIGHHARGHRLGNVIMAKSHQHERNLHEPGDDISADRQQTKRARRGRR